MADPTPPSLDAIIRVAAESWSGFRVPADEFRDFVVERGRASSRPCGELHVNDLYLACGCLRGDDAAWRELDRLHLSRIPEFVAAIDRSPAFADEVRQRLAEKLLHDAQGRPKLALYSGEGPLGGWIRVSAVREAQNMRQGARFTDEPDDGRLAAATPDAEEVLAKRDYVEAFRRAFEAVLAELPLDRRNVLRLHYLDGLKLDEIAKIYNVSRSTAGRWIEDVRQDLLTRVRGALRAELGQRADGPASVFALIESQLDLSIQRHFAARDDEG